MNVDALVSVIAFAGVLVAIFGALYMARLELQEGRGGLHRGASAPLGSRRLRSDLCSARDYGIPQLGLHLEDLPHVHVQSFRRAV